MVLLGLCLVLKVGAICVFVYWTFARCIFLFSGNAVFESWSSVLIANFVQDILFIRVCKVCGCTDYTVCA